MKRIFTLLLPVMLLLVFSCSNKENISPINTKATIAKVTLDGIGVRDTLTFNYKEGRVTNVNWCTYVQGASAGCLTGYLELRHYNDSGELDSISGRWHIFYFYEMGLRKKIIAYYDNQYYSTTNLEYTGTYPTLIKVHFAASDPNDVNNVELKFDSSGDLTRKTIKNSQGVLIMDSQIQYSTIENPLQGIWETISFAVEFFDFDDFVFHYSKHVPLTITNPVAVLPGNPVLQHSITYKYKQDASGRLISASAFITNHEDVNVHNILIEYNK
jgi:hypothetical protein